MYTPLLDKYEYNPRRFYKRRAVVTFALYIAVIYMHGAFPAIGGASSVKNWHPPRAVREKRE
jgi:hypothetical protein